MKIYFTFAFMIMILLQACDSGLAPKPIEEKTFLNGTLHFIKGVDNWPPADSLFGIRVAAFKSMPDENIIQSIISGEAYFTPESLGKNADTLNFSIEISDAPVNLVYIVAVQQYELDITSQRVIGVYTTTGDKTKNSELTVEKGKIYDIDIDIDFDDLPPMPF